MIKQPMADYTKHSDQALIDLIKSNDQFAFTEIYNRYWKKLFTVAANKLNDLAEAEDIVQQIFITIWNRRTELQIKTTLDAYLAVSVKYRVFRSIDKNSRRQEFSDEAATAALLEILDDTTRQWLEFQEISARLEILIAALPEKCRLVFKLSREQGYSQKQIAQELSISENTVEAHMGKALRSLRAGLKSFFLIL